MLVLTRKVGEKILIGKDIVVNVIDISHGNVRIGIEAPGRISILRFEVYERIREENMKAADTKAVQDISKVVDYFRRQA